MRGITELSSETSIDLGEPLPINESGLTNPEPYRMVVIGETNAGKSSLINALADLDLCSISDLPNTTKIASYQFGAADTDDDTSDTQSCHKRPIDDLRDFTWIDTPGIRSDKPAWQAELEDLLPSTDLTLCVLPISNPWGAPTWNFIAELPESTLKQLVLVVQQVDQRKANDIPVILNHVNDLALKRLSHIPPVFAVSAKLAQSANLDESGITELKQFIASHIDDMQRTQQYLDGWRSHASTALTNVEDQLEEQARNLRDQGRFMEEIEHEIHEMRETFIKRLPTHLTGVARAFELEAASVTKILKRKLSATLSIVRLFIGDKTGIQMENIFIHRIKSTIEKVAEKDGREVVDACKNHWEELGIRVKETMGIDLTTAAPIDETLTQSQKHFIARIDHAAHQGINNLKVRNQLDKELRRRNIALKSFTFMVLAFTMVGAICGALFIPWAPYILCGIAFVFCIGGFLTAWITQKSITNEFKTNLLDTCGAFASTLHKDYEEALQIVFRDYADSLSSVREHMAREKIAVEPRLRRWQELFLTLKTIEQDL